MDLASYQNGNNPNYEANRKAIADAGGIAALVALCASGTEKQKEEAAAALCCLAYNNDDNRVLIANEGAIPVLIRLATSGTTMEQKRHAAGALSNLAYNASLKAQIRSAGYTGWL